MKTYFVFSTIILLLFAIILLFTFTACTENEDPSLEVWEELFNGQDLSGWTANFNNELVGVNYKNTFRVEGGLLRASYTEWDSFNNKFGHLFHEKSFSYYKIKSQYRFVGKQPEGGEEWAYKNNGLMLHCQSPESMTYAQAFPMSLEFQLLGGNGQDERTNGNLCTPGCDVIIDGKFVEEHCISADSPTYHGEQWVTAEAVVLGDSIIHHILNGDTVISYSNPTIGGWCPDLDTTTFITGTPLKEGLISVQAESHPTDFKNISVLDLCGCMDPKAKNFKSYFIKSDNSKCVY